MRQTNITATIFGGSRDGNRSAYDNHVISNSEHGVALPFHFHGQRPKVRVSRGDKSVVCSIVDVGPWYDGRHGWPVDPYWETNARPRAEGDRRTNHAGIDLSPAAGVALGIPGAAVGQGKAQVDWEFILEAPVDLAKPEPAVAPPPTPPETPFIFKAPDPTPPEMLTFGAPEESTVTPPPTPPEVPHNDTLSRQTWPHENTHDLVAFYGDPRVNRPAWEAAHLAHVPIPWKANASAITIHKRCADSLRRVVNVFWDKIGRNQAFINQHHLNDFDGSYVFRTIRGSSNLSMHGYACALDFASTWNELGTTWHQAPNSMPVELIECFQAEGWSWGGLFGGRKDPMHFEATDLGQHRLVA